MKNVTEVHGKLIITKALKNSYYGNPRYEMVIVQGNTGYTVVTKPNAALGYEITNYNGKEVKATIGRVRGVLSVERVELI